MTVSATAGSMATSCATFRTAMDGTSKDGRMVMMAAADRFRIGLYLLGLS